jgi:hypothetical protein
VIVALFTNRTAAEAALRDLKAAGFSDEHIGIIMRDPGKPDFRDDSLIGGLVRLLGSLRFPAWVRSLSEVRSPPALPLTTQPTEPAASRIFWEVSEQPTRAQCISRAACAREAFS